MGPLLVVILIAAAVCAFVWIASLISKTNSWVDQLWSIVPVIYVWVFAGFAGLTDGRLNLMALLVTLWGARLTFNFARKGGYTGEEDYRWPVLRARMKPWQFQVFNLLFIVLYQNAILVLITLPALTAFEHQGQPARHPGLGARRACSCCCSSARRRPTSSSGSSTRTRRRSWRPAVCRRSGSSPAGCGAGRGIPTSSSSRRSGGCIFLFGALAAGSLLQWTVLGAVLLARDLRRLDDLHRVDHDVEVSRVRRVPGDDLRGRAVVPEADGEGRVDGEGLKSDRVMVAPVGLRIQP